MTLPLGRKKLSSLLSLPSISAAHHCITPFLLCRLSSPASATASLKSPFTADYLISSCGLPPDKATKISKLISTRITSTDRPSSVLLFLKNEGFTESHIRTLITGYPDLLFASPDKTLRPNLLSLRRIPSISPDALLRLLLYDPSALRVRAAAHRISFWMDFLGGGERSLIRAFQNNRGLIRHDIDDYITPRISFLRNRGFDDYEIGRIVQTAFLFITSSVDRMESMLKRAEDLGFVPGTPMFALGLRLVTCAGGETLRKKMELMVSLGWSEDEFFAAMRRVPHIGMLSEENLKEKMKFLVRKAGLDPSWVASQPAILGHSLEKRIIPRCRVLDTLEAKGLLDKRQHFSYANAMTYEKFIKRYILPWKEDVPELHQVYVAASSG